VGGTTLHPPYPNGNRQITESLIAIRRILHIMRLIAQLKRWFGLGGPPAAAHTFSTSGPIDALLRGAWASGWVNSGPVSRDEAMSVGAVERGRDVLCSIAVLPLVTFRGLESLPSAFLDQPDPDVPRVVMLSQTVEDLLCEAIAWWRITGKDYRGFPTSARRVDPATVSLTPPTDWSSPAPLPSGHDPRGAAVWIDGIEVPAAWVIRFDSPGRPLLSTAHRTIRRALLLDALAAMYAANPRPLEVFTDTDDQTVVPYTDEQVEVFLAQYMMGRRRGGPAYIPREMTRSDVSAPSPSELQLVELQREVSLELALHMSLDPEEVGVNTTSRTYFNAQDRRTDKINHTFGPLMAAITDRLSMGDVTPRGQYVRFDLTEYLRPDPASQVAYWQGLKGMGIVSDDWIARQAGIGSGDRATGAPPPAAPALTATIAPALVARRQALALPAAPADYRITGNSNPVMAGATFAGETPAGMRFSVRDFAGARPSTAADVSKRTITGLAVPFGHVARKFGVGFRFRPGSLEYDAGALNRLRVMDGHATYVGVHQGVQMNKDGPVVTLHILDGPEGSPTKMHRDQLLMDAAGGLADGLSVGVDFSLNPEDGDVEWSEADQTYDVVRATWLETSVTPDPAFAGARVTKVAASTSGGTMECNFCHQAHPAGMACAVWAQLHPQHAYQQTPAGFTLVPLGQQQGQQQAQQQQGQLQQGQLQQGQLQNAGAGQFAAQLPTGPVSAEQLTAALTGMVGQMIQNGQVAAAPPAATVATLDPGTGQFATPVNPRMALPGAAPTGQGQGTTSVTEPEPYRLVFNRRSGEYDLRPAKHDFSADLIGWLKDGDKAAGDRAHDFVRRNFNVATTDVDEVNPTKQRPDMWVDQRDYETPVWNAVYKGALTDITPFAFPKYNSSSGLVAAHTEGTEPSTGAYTVTNQTVSPTPYSGKARINREVWDQGGNPQVSTIIWNQMVRGAREAWEALVITTLNAGSFTALATLTAGAVDRAVAGRTLGNEIENGIALLQFARGGMRFRTAFAQADLYMGLKGATDTAGAPLYPIVGPANRNGTTATLFGEIDMGGMPFIPTWALAAVGQTAATKSYLVDPTAVHAWSSAPQRLTLDGIAVAYVDLGIWGYQAAAVSDTAGVRTITWDPVA
jgi:hypothetical protein